MAKAARSILLVRYEETEPDASAPTLLALGTIGEVRRDLERFNVAVDGDPSTRNLLYGPGVVVTLPMLDDRDEVTQLLVTITEESIAWSVIMRICRSMRWRMMEA